MRYLPGHTQTEMVTFTVVPLGDEGALAWVDDDGNHYPLGAGPEVSREERRLHAIPADRVRAAASMEEAAWPRRPRRGPCPYCHAPEGRWCAADCQALDRMDYR